MDRKPVYKKNRKNKNTSRNIIAYLIVGLMVAAIGIANLGKLHLPGHSSAISFNWDNNSPLAIALDTSPPSVLIFQKDQKKITFLSANENMYFVTGKVGDDPISQVGKPSKDDLSRIMSLEFGAPIENYMTLKKNEIMNTKGAEGIIKELASFSTPFAILTTGKPGFVKSTNITRKDIFRLWWQVKGIDINSVKFTDLTQLGESVVDAQNQKVLGVDVSAFNREISGYLANINIQKEKYDIFIVNNSGNSYASVLASNFIEAVGGNVTKVENGNTVFSKSQLKVSRKGDYTPTYLAKVFGCDINEAQNTDGTPTITIILGRDFADRYFK